MIVSRSGKNSKAPFYLVMIGTLTIYWSARVAFLLYVAALAGWLTGKNRLARLAWTCGFLAYLIHVGAAFHFHHHWSHSAAYEETARRTAELFGVRSGGGLYCNYAFTVVWALDVVWIWQSAETYRRRPRWIGWAVHSFIAFMFFNATVIFVSGSARWVGVAATVGIGILWLRTRRSL
jgi:hypothetical protein